MGGIDGVHTSNNGLFGIVASMRGRNLVLTINGRSQELEGRRYQKGTVAVGVELEASAAAAPQVAQKAKQGYRTGDDQPDAGHRHQPADRSADPRNRGHDR